MTRTAVAALALGLACACGCRVARPPEESATRVLALDRRLPVVVVSDPPGRTVYQAVPGAEPQAIGHTPLVLTHVSVTKEIWKHGATAPPASGSGFELERDAHAVERETGEAMTWTLFTRNDDGRFRELVFRLAPGGLEEAYSRGRVVLTLNPSQTPR